MKNRLYFSYASVITQSTLLILATLLLFQKIIAGDFLLRVMRYHLIIDLLLSLFVLYSLYHFIRTSKASSKMRKAAGLQKEVKSKRIQLLILFLMGSLVFYSLFYTVPMNKYIPSAYQTIAYYVNSLSQFLLLISLIVSHENAAQEFVKSKQKYAGVGAGAGLLLFYTYFQLVN